MDTVLLDTVLTWAMTPTSPWLTTFPWLNIVKLSRVLEREKVEFSLSRHFPLVEYYFLRKAVVATSNPVQ